MPITLRKCQFDTGAKIEQSWLNGHNYICAVLPTGAGKTILKAEMARREQQKNPDKYILMFAHRDVLLGQISNALCLFGLEHSFITSKSTMRQICDEQVENFGRSFYNERSRIIVCSVDTFYRRDLTLIAPHVCLWMMDETHHLLDDSKWHRCIDPLTKAKGLGVTATPIRADKKGLGRDYDGVFDDLIIGATMHELIQEGSLSTYKIFTPPVKADFSSVKVTASGDFNTNQQAKVMDRREITGDAVEHYKRLAHNKQTIVFTVNIKHSDHVAAEFRKAGYNAVSVSSKTKPSERNRIIKQFKAGEIQILVNCDLFGEGFDVPAVECVIMLRKTESYALFKQQFGRMLRVIEGKQYGILIDHVGNVEYMMTQYALKYPHDDPEWSLKPPTKRSRGAASASLTRVCPACFNRYMPTTANNYECPECSHVETAEEEIDALKQFQAKEGNLVELSVDIIDKLIKDRANVDRTPAELRNFMKNAPHVVRNSAVVNHTKRLNSQILLRQSIQKWCMFYYKLYTKVDIKAVQQQFELKFQIHPAKAALLGSSEADQLKHRIDNDQHNALH